MQFLKKGLIAALCAGALVACATSEKSMQEKGLKPMSEAEYRSLLAQPLSGRWTSAQNASGTVAYTPDGTVVNRPPSGELRGRYRINGNLFCATYAEAAQGAERCGRWYKTGEREYQVFSIDGAYFATLRMDR